MLQSKNGLFKGANLSILIILIIVAALILPLLSFAGRDKIYVDKKATGTENGSASHPYRTIKKALKEANDDDEVHIAAGTYEENIDIPRGVEVYGSAEDKVIIKADNNDQAVVKMEHKTKINKVTIRGGRFGIKVDSHAKVSIIECTIKDNKRDGVMIEAGEVSDKRMVSISESTITKNGMSGIFSGARRLSIIDTEINKNDKDGLDFAGGTSAWLSGNRIRENGGSGAKFTLDGANIWTKNNSFSDNGREGLEVNAYGKAGKIDIKKARIAENDNFGVVRVQRKQFPASIWNGFVLQNDNKIFSNGAGNISGITWIVK